MCGPQVLRKHTTLLTHWGIHSTDISQVPPVFQQRNGWDTDSVSSIHCPAGRWSHHHLLWMARMRSLGLVQPGDFLLRFLPSSTWSLPDLQLHSPSLLSNSISESQKVSYMLNCQVVSDPL